MAQSSLGSPLIHTPGMRASRLSRRPSALLAGPWLFVLSDLLWLTVAVTASYFLYDVSTADTDAGASPMDVLWMLVGFVGLSMVSLSVSKSYQPSEYGVPGREWPRTVGAVSFVIALLWLLSSTADPVVFDPALGAWIWGAVVPLLLAGRFLTRLALQGLRSLGVGHRRVLVVGSPKQALPIAQRLGRKGSLYQVVGLVDAGSSQDSGNGGNGHQTTQDGDGTEGFLTLGNIDSLPALLQAAGSREVLVAVPPSDYPRVQSALEGRTPPGTTIRMALAPEMEGLNTQNVEWVEGVVAVRLQDRAFSWQYATLKRAFDVVVSAVALVMAAPLMAFIAILIKLDSPGPVFYRQTRVGRGGRPFRMWKFRSMKVNAEELLKDLLKHNQAIGPMFKMERDPRITRVGRIIRKLSLDELPQLFNILNGSMSLVGPRPPLPDEVKRYQPWQFKRLSVVPGLTGLWQVSRGSTISFDEMVKLDIRYIQNWSLALDVVILFKTIPAVLRGHGAY